MTELTLDREQSRQVGEAGGVIIVRDAAGRRIGTMFPSPADDEDRISLSEESIDKIIRRAAQPREGLRTTAEVIARLEARFGK